MPYVPGLAFFHVFCHPALWLILTVAALVSVFQHLPRNRIAINPMPTIFISRTTHLSIIQLHYFGWGKGEIFSDTTMKPRVRCENHNDKMIFPCVWRQKHMKLPWVICSYNFSWWFIQLQVSSTKIRPNYLLVPHLSAGLFKRTLWGQFSFDDIKEHSPFNNGEMIVIRGTHPNCTMASD